MVRVVFAVVVMCGALLAFPGRSAAGEPAAGQWKLDEAVSNNGNRWSGIMVLVKHPDGTRTGHFEWKLDGGRAEGNERFVWEYDSAKNEIKITGTGVRLKQGTIKPAVYTAKVGPRGLKMHGTWTGPDQPGGTWKASREK